MRLKVETEEEPHLWAVSSASVSLAAPMTLTSYCPENGVRSQVWWVGKCHTHQDRTQGSSQTGTKFSLQDLRQKTEAEDRSGQASGDTEGLKPRCVPCQGTRVFPAFQMGQLVSLTKAGVCELSF